MEVPKTKAVFLKLLLITIPMEQSKLEPVYPRLPVKVYIYCAHRDKDCSSCITAELAPYLLGRHKINVQSQFCQVEKMVALVPPDTVSSSP